LAQHDVRLDDQIWKLKTLERICDEDGHDKCDDPFWYGVSVGRKRMEILFELKMESGIWKH